MRCAGVDIGSRSIEIVVVDDGEIIESRRAATRFDPLAHVKHLMDGISYDRIMATGYGRNLFEAAYASQTVTEIKAYSVGARSLFPEVQAILDIGGQDSKAIAVNASGRIIKFEMNDRCAAGTGKFLEIMAQALDFDLDAFGNEALLATKGLAINSMCTVFAESEVTTLIARGEERRNIAHGLHEAVAQRAANMLRRVWTGGPIFFAGGVARNSCICSLLAQDLGQEIFIPEDPQMVGALGAALLVSEYV
jgi:predicted CoA-substrate-specific enzyme activase